MDDAPVFQHIGTVRDLERQAGHLLDHEDRGAAGAQALDDLEGLAHQLRSEAEGRLVHEQELGSGHESACNGQHLLLTAGQRSGPLAPALAQTREKREAVLKVAFERTAGTAVGAQHQVLLHAHPAEHLAALGHQRDAPPDERVGFGRGDVLAGEPYGARSTADFERCIAELGSELHRNNDPDGRQHGFVCLYGLGTASDELERQADALAREHGVVLHQHEAFEPASTQAETERLGHSRIVHLDSLGVLHAGSTLVHMNTLTDEDADIVSERGCSVVWCPIPHLAKGLAGKVECRMPQFLRRGVNVTLGSDSARGNSFGDDALAAQLVAANAGELLAPEAILEMLTINAARSTGLDAIAGSLEAGKRADLVVTDPDAPEAYPGANPLHQAVLTCRGRARAVLVNGEVVIEDGRSTRIDERDAFARAHRGIRERIRRLGLGAAMQWPVAGGR